MNQNFVPFLSPFVPTKNDKPRLYAPYAPYARNRQKQGEQEIVMILGSYWGFRMEERVLWEQEVGGSNPLAPTNDFKYLERIRVEPVFILSV